MILYTTLRNHVPEHALFWELTRHLDDRIDHDAEAEGDRWEGKPRSVEMEYMLRGVEKSRVPDGAATLEDIDRSDFSSIASDPALLVPLIEEAERKWSGNRAAEHAALDLIFCGGVICEDYSSVRKPQCLDEAERVVGENYTMEVDGDVE